MGHKNAHALLPGCLLASEGKLIAISYALIRRRLYAPIHASPYAELCEGRARTGAGFPGTHPPYVRLPAAFMLNSITGPRPLAPMAMESPQRRAAFVYWPRGLAVNSGTPCR